MRKKIFEKKKKNGEKEQKVRHNHTAKLCTISSIKRQYYIIMWKNDGTKIDKLKFNDLEKK